MRSRNLPAVEYPQTSVQIRHFNNSSFAQLPTKVLKFDILHHSRSNLSPRYDILKSISGIRKRNLLPIPQQGVGFVPSIVR